MTENWITITDRDVLDEFTPVEKLTLESIQGSVESLGRILVRVTAQVRKAYRDGGREVAFTDGTVPGSEAGRVIALARWKWLLSLPGLKDDPMCSADRRRAWETADEYFRQIAARELKSEGGAQVFERNQPQATRRNLNGLL